MNDDLLLAAVEPEVAVLVCAHHVAGIQPSIDDSFLGRLGIVPVGDHIARKFDPKTPVHSGRHLLPVLVAQ